MKIVNFSFLLLMVGFLLTSCKNNSENKAEVTDAGEVAMASGATFTVDADESDVLWEGYKPTGTHNGTVDITDGSISVEDGKIAAGNFTIDMKSITVLDLEGDYKTMLENHLKGVSDNPEKNDDFFSVHKYPTAKFEITNVTGLDNDAEATHLVYGNLTLKDITKQVGFKANVDVTEDAVRVSTPQFEINRTDWGINHKSKSIFDNLKDDFINDEIGLKINLVAKG